MDWVALFCDVDDFCQEFEPAFERRLLQESPRKRRRKCKLALSEMMTIVIAFQMSWRAPQKSFHVI